MWGNAMMSVPEPLISGADAPLAEPMLLRAGPLTVEYEAGDLRYIRFAGQELVRRIYVALRDRNWGTVPAVLADETIEITERSFRISYTARHQEGDIDFVWRAVIDGDVTGTLRFMMDGEAQTTFLRNRIGFCILYPAALAGTVVQIEHSDGRLVSAAFPERIVAAQPVPQFDDLRALHLLLPPSEHLVVRSEGDTFEMEDQRNWTDASFKVFCTPLRLPYPVEVRAGTLVRQAVTLEPKAEVRQGTEEAEFSIQDSEAAVEGGRHESGDGRRETVTLPFKADRAIFALDVARKIAALPRIGLGLAHEETALAGAELTWLRLLRPAHLRVDLDMADPQYLDRLSRANAEGRALDASLEIALFLSERTASAELTSLRAQLDTVQLAVARWLIFSRERPITPPAVAALARALLASYAPGAVFAGGSNSDYIFVDRNTLLPETLDALSVAINPQVHAFDNASLVETLAAQGVLVNDARQYAGRPVVISPVTLRPRFNPYATAEVRIQDSAFSSVGASVQLPPSVDRRQSSLFAAAWTLGSLRYLGLAGTQSVTYYETHGWRGVLDSASRTQDSGLRSVGLLSSHGFPVNGSAVFPLFHVLVDVAEMRGASLVLAESSDPLLVDGLALRDDGRVRVLLANMSAQPQQVLVRGLSEGAALRVLDTNTLREAMAAPLQWREQVAAISTPGGETSFDLAPYAIVRLDVVR
jgi:hypothetical protein